MATEQDVAEKAVGMPQLDFSTFGNQIFWLLVALFAIYYILVNIALPRIAGTLADRQEAIADDLEQAAELNAKAAEAEKAYQQALMDARTEAQRIGAETKAEIQKELDVAIAKADAEIAARASESETRIKEIRDGAMASVEQVAGDTAEALVAALLPDVMDKSAVSAAVTDAMKGRGK